MTSSEEIWIITLTFIWNKVKKKGEAFYFTKREN